MPAMAPIEQATRAQIVGLKAASKTTLGISDIVDLPKWTISSIYN